MDRCELARQYHDRGFNCAQSVAAAFQDRMGLGEREILALSGGFGGGVGGTHRELCGALSGAAMVLGALHPHLRAGDPEGKAALYALVQELHRRFEARFGPTCCQDLLRTKLQPAGRAAELGVTGHCNLLIVETVELLERLLEETA